VNRAITIAALLALSVGAPARAEDPPARDGDVYLSYSNDDFYHSRFGTELLWVQPLFPWLDGEIGGHYSEFDDATWGHGILGAHAWLPLDLGHLTLRYEGGAGDSEATGHYAHHIGDIGWTIPVYARLLHFDTGLKLIRVDRVEEDLARVGLAVLPTSWLSLHGGYWHSTREAHGTEVWTARGDVTLRKIGFFASYVRSRDTLDLQTVGRGKVLGEPTDQYIAGVTLPFGRHGLTLSYTRFEDANPRDTVMVTWRWSLGAAPWSFAEAPEPPAPIPAPNASGLP